MSLKHTLWTLSLVAAVTAGCETQRAQGPLATMPTGTRENVMRQQQLQNVQGDPSRAMQNPAVVGVNPGTTGIVREGTGTGGTGAGAPVAVNPGAGGIIRQPGVGAPMR